MSNSSTEYQAYKWCTTAQSVDNTGRITLPNTEAFYAINPSCTNNKQSNMVKK